MSTTRHYEKPSLSRDELREIIGLSLWAGQMLLQWGADSRRVEETMHRIGTGLGCDWMDIVVQTDALIATTTSHGDFRTQVRRAPMRGVDMAKIDAINDLSYRIQAQACDRHQAQKILEEIDQTPRIYSPWLTTFAGALACAAFSRLFGGDAVIFGITFVATSVAMIVRQWLQSRHLNIFVATMLTAFVGGMISASAHFFDHGHQASIALAATALLLVPGVPLINAAEDLLNGHVTTGTLRGVQGALIALSIALGLFIALWLTGGNTL